MENNRLIYELLPERKGFFHASTIHLEFTFDDKGILIEKRITHD